MSSDAVDPSPLRRAPELVFAYGALASDLAGGRPATLRGHRRCWGVAMDNSEDLPGYKHYRLRSDGCRPEIFVAFLDIAEDPDLTVAGVCLPVGERLLEALDLRERNYHRVDVTASVDGATARVWAYQGSAAGRARLRRGVGEGRAVVSRDYLRAIPGDVPDTGALPVWDLERVEHAGQR